MGKFKKSIVMYHDNSGQDDIFEVLGKISPNILQLSNETVFFKSENKGDFYNKCEELQDFDLVIVVGGDGTINEVINGLYHFDLSPTIGVIPAGSFNDFSKTLNLEPDPVGASEQLLNATAVEYDCILNDDKLALNFWTVGLVSNNAEKMKDANKETFGVLSYIPKTIETLTEDNSFDYVMKIDGKEYSGNASMVFVANGKYSGSFELPIDSVSANDGKLNVFILKQSNLSALKALFNKTDEDNFNQENEDLFTTEAEEIEFISPENLTVDTDGELYQTTPSKLKVINKRFKFLTNTQK